MWKQTILKSENNQKESLFSTMWLVVKLMNFIKDVLHFQASSHFVAVTKTTSFPVCITTGNLQSLVLDPMELRSGSCFLGDSRSTSWSIGVDGHVF